MFYKGSYRKTVTVKFFYTVLHHLVLALILPQPFVNISRDGHWLGNKHAFNVSGVFSATPVISSLKPAKVGETKSAYIKPFLLASLAALQLQTMQ